MTPALEALNQDVLARIAAMGASSRADIDADRRIVFLNSIADAAPEITEHGHRGFVQMMTDLTSSAHWRRKRITCLIAARRSKLKGFPKSLPMWLGKAADYRREEQFRLGQERIATRICADVRAAAYEQVLQRIAGQRHTEFGDEPACTAVEAMTASRIVISEMQKGAGQ